MSKIENDKYYTPISLANYCWDKVFEVIGEENISEIIEPSCGDGAFYHHSEQVPHFGYDTTKCKGNPHNCCKVKYQILASRSDKQKNDGVGITHSHY